MEYGFTGPVAVAAVLCLNVAVTEWLVRRTWLRHLGTALLVIMVTAVTANLGVIPTGGKSPLYQGILDYVAPLAIFLPLLEVNLRDIFKAGASMIGAFAVGALGTFLAVPLAMWAVGGKEAFGSLYSPLGGMFIGTYTGGSVNFNAIALHYGVVKEGVLYTGAVAVDNIVTAVWMVATLAVPRAFGGATAVAAPSQEDATSAWVEADTAGIHPLDLAILGGLGFASLWVSELLAGALAQFGLAVPSVLILTTIALVLAQFPAVRGLQAVRPLSLFAIYLFLAVIGAFCDFPALLGMGSLGVRLLLLATLVVAFHGVVAFSAGRLLTRDWGVMAVASQANIGGPASALALARSLGRSDLLLPAVLVGALGYGLGTYLGFAAAAYVLVW